MELAGLEPATSWVRFCREVRFLGPPTELKEICAICGSSQEFHHVKDPA